MNQDLGGQQADKQKPDPKKFLGEYVEEAVSNLQKERDPSQFERIARGVPGMTLADNAQYYT